jgi:two-component system CAI-1 autoinducer sensor kinase/phosphatase CqsS
VLPDTPNWEEVRRVYIEPTPLYGFILVVGSLAIRNREIIDQEKLAAVSAVGATIAHELRTPILGIKSLAEGIESFLPTLISGYNAAVANGIQVEPIRTRHLAALRTSLQQIKEETDYSNQVIGMLLINSSQQPLRGLEFELLSARECVETAVFRFPFSNKKERESLDTLIENDFEVRAPEVLIVHVLFNLIKNAIYYVDKAGGGAIRIRVRASTREIIVEDEGTGITADNLPKIFDRFFTTTTTGHGSGIGLSFCRMVMQEIGGAIACDSVPGQYTRFTLSFPAAGGTE